MLLNGSCGQYRPCIKRNLLFRFGTKHLSTLPTRTMLTQCWFDAGAPAATLAQHQTSTGSTRCVCWAAFNPVNTKHLHNICTTLGGRCTNVIQMVCVGWKLQLVWYCLILLATIISWHRPNVCQMLGQRHRCWPVSTMLWTKAGLMLARRLWRWPTFSVAPNITR